MFTQNSTYTGLLVAALTVAAAVAFAALVHAMLDIQVLH
jgi:hypothetical protein